MGFEPTTSCIRGKRLNRSTTRASQNLMQNLDDIKLKNTDAFSVVVPEVGVLKSALSFANLSFDVSFARRCLSFERLFADELSIANISH